MNSELVLALINNGLLATLALLLGLWLNRRLESFKHDMGTRHEQHRMRQNRRIERLDAQIEEVWQPLLVRLKADGALWTFVPDYAGSMAPRGMADGAGIVLKEGFLLSNKQEIVNLLLAKSHLIHDDEVAGPSNDQMLEAVAQAIRHIEVDRALIGSRTSMNPIDVGAQWPKDFEGMVEARIEALRARRAEVL